MDYFTHEWTILHMNGLGSLCGASGELYIYNAGLPNGERGKRTRSNHEYAHIEYFGNPPCFLSWYA
jgi:hypothetical protein